MNYNNPNYKLTIKNFWDTTYTNKDKIKIISKGKTFIPVFRDL
jgi:hypothetical protein